MEELEFKEIEDEESRIYLFPEGDIQIDGVVRLAVTKSTHRLECANGDKVIIPNRWIGIEIKAPHWSF